MDEKQVIRMATGKGFIAALDQSGGSTPKALEIYGVLPDSYHNDEEMFQKVHEMRTRIIKSPVFTSEHIVGAILFEGTMERKIDDLGTAEYLLEKKGILPFLKIDKGLAPEENGVQKLKPIPGLDELLAKANAHHIFGTKERSVIKLANPQGIKEVVAQQLALAQTVFTAGLIPIVEPEVSIDSPEKAEAEVILKRELQKQLAELPADTKVMLKLSLPSIDNFYDDLADDPHVVRVVALSGGYSQADANSHLAKNTKMIASFSRALSEGLLYQQTDEAFNEKLGKSIEAIYQASVGSEK